MELAAAAPLVLAANVEFTVECRIRTLGIAAIGSGASRRLAEQAAAERAYAATLAQDGGGDRG